MKRKSSSLLAVLGICLLISCNNEEEIPALSEEMKEPENLSEIALLEEELGTTFFKKDFTLTDDTGENQVTLRVASPDEKTLENYLNVVNLSMTPVYRNAYPEAQKPQEKNSNFPDGKTEQAFEGIITEFISENLNEDVIGLRLNVEVKENKENLRTQVDYNYISLHTSMKWPYLAKVTTYSNSLEIKYNFEAKDRWYKSWFTGYAETCKYNGNFGQDLTQCNFYWFQPQSSENTIWVDGPYKVRARVSYWNTGSYSVEFIRRL